MSTCRCMTPDGSVIRVGDWVVVDFTEGTPMSSLVPGKGTTWQADGQIAYIERIYRSDWGWYADGAFIGGGHLGFPVKHIIAKVTNGSE